MPEQCSLRFDAFGNLATRSGNSLHLKQKLAFRSINVLITNVKTKRATHEMKETPNAILLD